MESLIRFQLDPSSRSVFFRCPSSAFLNNDSSVAFAYAGGRLIYSVSTRLNYRKGLTLCEIHGSTFWLSGSVSLF